MRPTNPAVLIALALLATIHAPASAQEAGPRRAEGGAHSQAEVPAPDNLTPEERMNGRFPQNVRVGDLLGLPLLDLNDRTLGHVEKVVRTPQGKILLMTSYGGWFGYGGRPVPVPIEAVAILARQIALLDIPREDLPRLATGSGSGDTVIPPDTTIKIAITRR